MKTNSSIYFLDLKSEDSLTLALQEKGVSNINQLINFIQNLPYGRNENREDLKLVLSELKGTCSSKHAFVQEIANRNKINGIQLILGMYKMNQTNTPKIGELIKNEQLDYIPEAHCYLKIENQYVDITSINSKIETVRKSLLQEVVIQPNQVASFKVNFHQLFIQDWIKNNSISHTFEEIWELREKCITALSY